jgi:hypothetical protein
MISQTQKMIAENPEMPMKTGLKKKRQLAVKLAGLKRITSWLAEGDTPPRQPGKYREMQ